MSGSKLTAEQLQRIEENKRKALAKLAHKNKSSNPYQKQITQFQNTERIVQGTSFGQPQSSKSSMQETGSKVLLAPNTQIRDEAKTSPFCNGNSVSGAKTKVESKQENIPSNISAVPVSSNLPKSITTDADRIEQNRLKALALRAERLNKSPTKPPDNVINLPPKPLCNTISSEKIMCPPGHSDSNPLCFQNQNNMQGLMSFQKGTNVFANASAPGQSLSFKGTPVKGDCVLVARDRFTVKAGYSAPLVQLIKMSHVVNLKPAVVVEPLPKPLVTAFAAQIKGDNSSREIPIADLSRVEDSLVSSLMSFQRTGAICLSRYYKEEWPLLVVVPSSVRFDWSQRWIPTLNPQTINVVVTGKDSCTSGLINILSYDLMARKAEELKKKMFQVIIMDECHLLKNYKTARCKAALPLLQLPDKIRQMILLDPSSIRVSKELKTASKVMTSANLKDVHILEGERKILIFAHHGDILDAIEGTVRERIGNNYMRIDGKTNSEQRNFSCRKFQTNEDMRVAILSITAANAGLNLSSANLVVFAELFWNPGDQRQQEITQFLDESFHIDTSFTKDDTMDDAKPSTSPRKVVRQQSILNYVSPMKANSSSAKVESQEPKLKQTSLFSSYSKTKSSQSGGVNNNEDSEKQRSFSDAELRSCKACGLVEEINHYCHGNLDDLNLDTSDLADEFLNDGDSWDLEPFLDKSVTL
ncbi:LOW QUALITY PROTEIN: SMAL1-like protein [Mya arenaria]|uniref:SMAL1-like protein n=1 Tax=Mya arenaria TaxID=6604 RepID=A0ABY7DBM6_MYAAR|nr:LOW QUALITY PROTEIN: SMAL1-like protein [Mya arenaria]